MKMPNLIILPIHGPPENVLKFLIILVPISSLNCHNSKSKRSVLGEESGGDTKDEEEADVETVDADLVTDLHLRHQIETSPIYILILLLMWQPAET